MTGFSDILAWWHALFRKHDDVMTGHRRAWNSEMPLQRFPPPSLASPGTSYFGSMVFSRSEDVFPRMLRMEIRRTTWTIACMNLY